MRDEREIFKILEKDIGDDEIDWLYGGSAYYISNEQIEALKQGKKLYNTINDEYAFTIELKDDNK